MEIYPRTISVEDMWTRAAPQVIKLYEYWNGKRKGRSMPSRSDIDPSEMRGWLDGIQLIDVLDDPAPCL